MDAEQLRQLQRLNDERAEQRRIATASARFQLAALRAERDGQADQARHFANAARRVEGRPELPPPAAEITDADRQVIVDTAIRLAEARGKEDGIRAGIGAQAAVDRVLARRGYR